MDQAGDLQQYDLVLPPEVRRGSRRRFWTWLVLGAAALGIGGLILLLRLREEPETFRSVTLERRTIIRVVEATGQLDAVTRTEVPAPAAGALVEALVRSGAKVVRNQPLARLDAQAATIARRSARAALRSATERVAQAAAERDATKEASDLAARLGARGLSSENDVTQAQAKSAQARAALAAAQAEREVAAQNLAAAELAQTQRTLAAPTDGVVLQAPDALGVITAPERGPLFVIGSSLESLRIDAWVSESDIGEVRVAQPATFTVPAFPERNFSARVESLSVDATKVNARVRYLVRLSAPNADRALLPGMTATLRIEVARAPDVLSVREAALRFAPPGAPAAPPRSRLFLLGDKGALQAVSVRAGLSDGTQTEVRANGATALEAGEAVAIGRLLPSNNDPARGPGITLGRR